MRLSHWVNWTCCIQYGDRGRVARFRRFTRFRSGLVKLKIEQRIRPYLVWSFLWTWKRMSFVAARNGEGLSPIDASFSAKGCKCPRHKPTPVCFSWMCRRMHSRWRAQSPIAWQKNFLCPKIDWSLCRHRNKYKIIIIGDNWKARKPTINK